LKPVLKPGSGYLQKNQSKAKEFLMKNKLNLALFAVSKIDRQHIQLFFVLLSLVMLVLGVGAPDDGGTVNR
jgi:hypothetical protein